MLAKPYSKRICGACSVSNDLVETILSRQKTPPRKFSKRIFPLKKILRTNGIHTPMYGGRRYPLQAANAP
jgi:hypothetical protein